MADEIGMQGAAPATAVGALLARLRQKRPAAAAAAGGLAALPRQPGGMALSLAQERLWFMEQLQPGTPVYNIAVAVRLAGPLAVASLAAAFTAVTGRHEALRTVFAAAGGRPLQVIAPAAPAAVAVVDLGGLGAGAADAETGRLALAEARRPFDLARGPLLRTTLLRRGAAAHVLLLTLHHLVGDGVSMAVLLEEVLALYRAARHGRTADAALPPAPPIQYVDFAAWQRQRLPEILRLHLPYWREALAGSPQLLALPTDRPRPASQTVTGGRGHFALPPPLVDGVTELARSLGCTSFVVLLAAFQALLVRWSGQEDVVVGVPVANRQRVEIQRLIGLFVNMLAMRARTPAAASFAARAAAVHEQLLEALAHQELPFEKLVEELRPERTRSHAPLFQAVFAFQNMALAAGPQAELAIEPLAVDPGIAMFDLTLNLEERPGVLAGWFEHSGELFDRATVTRFARHFTALLAAVAAGGGDAGAGAGAAERVADIALLDAAERHQVAIEWNDTAAVFAAGGETLHGLVARQAALTPDAAAVACAGERLSYAALLAAAAALGRRLRGLGTGPEALVGICAERSLALPVGLLAVLAAGGAYVPLDPQYPAERLAFMLADAGVRVVVCQARLRHRLPAAAGLRVVLLADDGRVVGGDGAAAELPPDAVGVDGGAAAAAPWPAVAADHLAYVIYTSGSTGKPKGAMNSHGAVVNRLLWMQAAYRLEAADVVLQKTPYSFDVSVWELFWPLAAGACLVLARPGGQQDPAYLADLIRREGVSTLHFVPSMLPAFLATADAAACTSLRRIVASGEGLPRELAWRCLALLPAAELYNLYGPTEAAIDVTAWRCARPEERARPQPPPIGRPIANLRIRILDREMRPVAAGIAGELLIGGAGLARGYVNRPDLTAARFLPEDGEVPGARLYRSGDLASFRPDGAIDYLGRTDFQIKLRGFRIEAGEIEAVLAAHPTVGEAVVMARQHGPGDVRLVAYVVPAAGAGGGAAEVWRRHLLAALPAYMLPASFVTLAALPQNANGKLDRGALPAPDEERDAAAGEEPAAPRTPVEETLAAIWEDVLRCERVGAHDNFFALGGHSLLAPGMLARAGQALGLELPLGVLFDHPTVAGMAAVVEASWAERQPRALPLSRRAARPPRLPLSFPQLRLWLRQAAEGASGVANTALGLRLKGALSVPALRAALAGVAARHEILRTWFAAAADGEPFQAVAASVAVPLPVIDLAALPEAPAAAEAARLGGRAARHRFDLARAPLWSAVLLRRSAGDHALLVIKHHLITDGWSEGILAAELAALYSAAAAGEPSPLPPLPLQYGDFALWQRQALAGARRDELLAYWRTTLGGSARRPLALPTDRPRPAVRSLRGGRLGRRLERELGRGLHRLSRHAGASLFMTLLAAWTALLARWTGEDDVAIGTNVANRTPAATEPLIGLFTNVLVLRTDVSGNPRFGELLLRVRQTTLAAYAHQELPFVDILNLLRPGSPEAYNELFPAGFVLQNFPVGRQQIPGLDVELFELTAGAAPRDLILLASEVDEELRLLLLYRQDIFTAATAAGLLDWLERLLRAVVEEPDLRLLDPRLAGGDPAALHAVAAGL